MNTSNLEPPEGAGGKSVRSYNLDNHQAMSEGKVDLLRFYVYGKKTRTDLRVSEDRLWNLAQAAHNKKWASQHADPNFIEEVANNESYLDEPDTPLLP